MRYQLLIAALLTTVVSSRRGAPAPLAPPAKPLRQYGWGLEGALFPAPEEVPVQQKEVKVKQVKRVLKKPEEEEHPMKHGFFGHEYDPDHPCWKYVEDALSGLE